jgi:hypothetical protein
MAVIETEYDHVWVDLHSKRTALFDRRASLEADLSEVKSQIEHLNEILKHLGPLARLPGGDVASMGITDAIRWVLNEANGRKMSPADVRDTLVEKGFDLSPLTAPMASIYKILSRLASESEPEVFREKGDDGKVYYGWIRPEITDEEIPF